ncbi:MAG: CotH kinase family protein [candidate division KSB1 bacterium]|jgi:spore coat protein CotH|nr:CotH kinase family protein [candidate division KSB1 bacterium]
MKTKHFSFMFILLALTATVSGQDFYDINTINTIELTFAQSNWDYLLDQLYAGGQEERLIGTAVVNGITYDSVGVRYKGNSSYNSRNIKNPLNIKLDHIIEDQEHEGYGTLKLANGYKDPSYIRETLSYEIARKYMPASQANYARVYVNGSYLGLYTSVQDVDKHFLRTHFYNDKNAFFKGELASGEVQTPVKIWGYWGTDSTSYHDFYEIESDNGWAELIHFLDILNNTPSSVEDVLNVDRHLWMLAYDILLVNLDAPVNFGHNYYLYEDDTGRFNPIIWDLNENFGVFTRLLDGGNLNTSGMQQMDPFLNSTHSNYPIINKILSDPTYKKMYVAHMKTIMDEIFTNGWYRARALEIQDIIDTEVKNDPNQSYTYSQFKYNVDNSITTGGGRPGQNQSIVGIAQLMDSRISYLNALSEFQESAPEISSVATDPVQVTPNMNVSITAEVRDANTVCLKFRYSQTNAFQKVDMLDDGSHGDGAAGDGIYGASIPATATGFQYYVYAENSNAASFLPAHAAYEFYTLAVSGDVVVNEFMASNSSTIADPDGEYDDWIELFNNTDNDISLTGYYLSDDSDDLTQWAFPDTFIAANGYLIIWADKDEDQDGLHTNFKLSASGEVIYLVKPDMTVIDEVTFIEQTTDISTGRYPDGVGAFELMDPTFAAPNQCGFTDTINSDQSPQHPSQFELEQNYPNPFNPSTTIAFSLSSADRATLKIYNVTGQLMTTLVDQQLSQGYHEFQWTAASMPSGIYYYSLKSGAYSEAKRMILIR